ncbi:uncharacterized protein M6B38_189795 [Iris pallida]|uniref:Uncharacterized protein n=1 Tax=Iris pallida TaxID=29817 RepID=A0AAX6EI61_IRIPA|nr:uncharacterized protein M6B38_189795 [Iris pallida]
MAAREYGLVVDSGSGRGVGTMSLDSTEGDSGGAEREQGCADLGFCQRWTALTAGTALTAETVRRTGGVEAPLAAAQNCGSSAARVLSSGFCGGVGASGHMAGFGRRIPLGHGEGKGSGIRR